MPARLAQVIMALSFAAPCFGIGMRLLAVWRDPMSVEKGRWVGLGTGIFIMEFILLHAGVMLSAATAGASSTQLKLGGMLGLTAVYALFAGAIALGFKSPMLFSSFVWVVAGRFVALLVGISTEDQQLLLAHSLVGMIIYFTLVVSSVFLPWPRLGITEEVAAKTRAPHASGLWIEKPHRAIGPATVYFFLLGVAELTLMTWADPRSLIP